MTARQIAFIRQPGRGGTPQSPLVQQPQPWAIRIAGRAPADARRVAGRSRGRAAARSWTRCRERPAAPTCTGPPAIASSFLSYQDGWPHLYSIHHPDKGGTPLLLTPGAFMVEHVSLTPDRRFARLQRQRRRGSPRHRSPPPVQGAGRRLGAADAADERHRSRVEPGRDRRRPDGGVSRIDGAAAAAAGGRCRSREASRGRSRRDQVPAGFPSAKLVTPEPVTFRSSDGLEIHAQLFKRPGGDARRPALVYVHGGPPRQMLLGLHYMDYYANDYAVNQYPRQPRLHRAVGQLSAGHRLRPRVSSTRTSPARAAHRSTST